MKKQLFIAPKYLFAMAVALFTLSACGQSLESPENVISKAKEAITEVESGRLDVTATAEGNNGTDDLLFEGVLELAFDQHDEDAPVADVHVDVSGEMQAGEKSLNGDLDFDFVTLGQDYYVKLNSFSTNDDSLTAMQPFVDLYMGKWLYIAEDFIPEDIRGLQEQDEAAKLRQKQLKELFVETELFDVVKEYGIEKLNGYSVYHYGLSPNMNGFKDYMTKAAVIDGRELTVQEVEEGIEVLQYIKQAEVYIDVEDYYVLKSVFLFSGEALNEDSGLDVEVVMEGADYNETISVEAPEGAEEFNPLALMMGLGAAPLTLDENGLPLEELSLELEEVSEGVSDETVETENEAAEGIEDDTVSELEQ